MTYLILNALFSINFLLIYNSMEVFSKKEVVVNPPVHEQSNDDLERFATNKKIPLEIRDIALEALSYFPDLFETEIDFQFKKNINGSVMQAQPKIGSLLFSSKENRGYRIKISRYLALEDEAVPIETLPKEVLLGWIGHELGHIQDYLERSAFNLLQFGVKYYLSNTFLSEAEIAADSYAVAFGLGKHIIATKNFVLNHDKLPEDYKLKIRTLYMSPGEILSMVDAEDSEEDISDEN
ncbi:hypothetical protein SAMN04488057_1284 [Cyclobacterium lianum]|uniref:Uncharacterized protein n=1 Tax=Cyclobacterium lianum TaxID=388280 RepID=A0A1M7QVK9_9BACT|nr:hypothetical protein [Cyclobacterium lianum]SHN35601.1 hypothetical protein SAMN04488057_1284 [Cyclobacterium lianum]